MTERKNAQRYRAKAFNGNPNDPRRYFKTKPISLIGASCMLLCAQAFAQGAEEQVKVQQPAIAQSRPLDLNVSKGILLAATTDEQNGVSTMSAEADDNALPGIDEADLKLKAINVRAKRFYEVGPLPGLGLTKEEIPGNIQSITAEDIKNSHSLSITDLLNSKMQSINVNDYQGNPFQMDITYRGFTAGPQIGTPQGLAVFFDGIRVNEPFGDVVNWDLIPMNALAGLDVIPGSNPIYGLGALGGAITVKTKDGFNFTGVDAEVLTGSFGRKQLQASGGWNNGKVALFGAGNFFMEDGWRENSPSEVNQMFGKASYRGEKLDLHLSSLVAWNDLIGNGLMPYEMYKQNRNGVFTSPDTTDNRLWQFQLSGSYFVNDNFSITGQIYRRESKRKSLGADVYTEHQEGQGASYRRALNPGEQFTCLYNSTNGKGVPDYYAVPFNPNNPFDFDPKYAFFLNYLFTQSADFSLLPDDSFNKELTDGAEANFKKAFDYYKDYRQSQNYIPQASDPPAAVDGPVTSYSNGQSSWHFNFAGGAPNTGPGSTPGGFAIASATDNYYYDEDGTAYLIVPLNPINSDACYYPGDHTKERFSGLPLTVADPNDPRNSPSDGSPLMVDGASSFDGKQPGVVEGTPTALLSDTEINQITEGASIQFNWNFDKHKFMIGASIDAPTASYGNAQMLGLLDADRDAFLAPDLIREQYAAARTPVRNNDFEGRQITKSIYASETWSPIETLHVTGAMRYNETRGKNTIAARTWGRNVFDLSNFLALPDLYNICTNGVCPTTGYKVPDLTNLLNKAETEKFSYYSLNPSLGLSWQAQENLNFYTNWAQGTRTPSVIELGCAFDDTPVEISGGKFLPKSLFENRSCSLPTTLSGDPYLPQIKANTFDIGLRGQWGDNIEWNVGAYRTDLKDDIYMVGYPGNRNFFDTIGETRRQGIEAGISAAFGKATFSINYALTDATFQDNFTMPANDNSSSVEGNYFESEYSRLIEVERGDRMPGVPLQNLNASVNYALTSKWNVGLTAVAHSRAFVRGNENNEHREGVVLHDTVEIRGKKVLVARQPTTQPGHTDGYVMFNFRTSYQLNSEWTVGLLVNNIFDKEYFSAGRLGRNPFSPSIYGAIGPDGYNHNSSDWLSTNFLAPGAPRGAWVSLRYEFDPRK